MTNNIPTAEEFFIQLGFMPNHHKLGYDIKTAMIEFAKLHVEAQRECVEEEVSKTDLNTGRQASILNAYPLTNIK